MDLGGWMRLHNLELAAHWILTNDRPHFKQAIIPRKATELAARFSRALEPLFANTASESAFASWGEDNEASEDRRFRLKGIFEAALRLKAATVSTNCRYEFVLYPLGTSHAQEQPANLPSGVNGRRGLDDSLQNQSWRYASLHAYAAVASLPRDNFADALVSPKNFVSKTVEERAKLSRYNKFMTATKSEEARAAPGAILPRHAREHVYPTNPGPTNSISTNSMAIATPGPMRNEVMNSMSNRPRVRQVRSRAVSPSTPESSTIPPTQSSATAKKHVGDSGTSANTVKRSSKGTKASEEKAPTCNICKAEFASNQSRNRDQQNSEFLESSSCKLCLALTPPSRGVPPMYRM